MFRILVCNLVIVLICCSSVFGQTKRERVLVAAASDLKFALDSITAVYQKSNVGVAVEVSYGSSGKLSEQISNGAPFDIFFSADKSYPEMLRKGGHTISEITTYGFGRVVLWSRKPEVTSEGMNLMVSLDVKKVAIANPVHAPYGRAAEQSLKYYSLFEKVQGKLVFGENVSQAAQFITSGAADAGIIALSLALSPSMRKMNGHFYLIPAESHKPLEQAYVILGGAKGKQSVTQFDAFLKSEAVKKIFAYFGFSENR